MTDTQWTDWIEHKAGDPCPIPDAKAGDWWSISGLGIQHQTRDNAIDVSWDKRDFYKSFEITHYRLRKPPVDWKGIAEELADALKEAQAALNGAPNTVGLHSQMENAVTRYREAIKCPCKQTSATTEHCLKWQWRRWNIWFGLKTKITPYKFYPKSSQHWRTSE